MRLSFQPVSSVENDNHVRNKVKNFLGYKGSRRKMLHGMPKIQQLEDCKPLSKTQMNNLTGNVKRMVCCIQDDEEEDRISASLEFEEKTRKWLEAQDATFVEESVLMEKNRQRSMKGLPTMPTPDFLLIDPIQVRGHAVKWVECKNYYGTAVARLVRTLGHVRAAKKYSKHYGDGLMIFACGFNKDLETVDGVLYAAARCRSTK